MTPMRARGPLNVADMYEKHELVDAFIDAGWRLGRNAISTTMELNKKVRILPNHSAKWPP